MPFDMGRAGQTGVQWHSMLVTEREAFFSGSLFVNSPQDMRACSLNRDPPAATRLLC